MKGNEKCRVASPESVSIHLKRKTSSLSPLTSIPYLTDRRNYTARQYLCLFYYLFIIIFLLKRGHNSKLGSKMSSFLEGQKGAL